MNNFEKYEKICKIILAILYALSIAFFAWLAFSIIDVWVGKYNEIAYSWWNLFEIMFSR